MNWFRLNACAKCKGDLVLDDGDWICLQCGTYYYTGLYRNREIRPLSHETRPAPLKEKYQDLAQCLPGFSTHGGAPAATRGPRQWHRAGCVGPVVRCSLPATAR